MNIRTSMIVGLLFCAYANNTSATGHYDWQPKVGIQVHINSRDTRGILLEWARSSSDSLADAYNEWVRKREVARLVACKAQIMACAFMLGIYAAVHYWATPSQDDEARQANARMSVQRA